MLKKIRIISAVVFALVYLSLMIISKTYGTSSLLEFFKGFVAWVALFVNINTHYIEEKNAGKSTDKKKPILINLLMLGVLIVIVCLLFF